MASSSVCRYINKNETNCDDEDREITYYVTLEASASEIESSDVDSIESFQANTTVSAKDTSDLSTDNKSESSMSEFEVNYSTDSDDMAFLQEPLSTTDSAEDIRLNVQSVCDSESNLSDISNFHSDVSGPFDTNQFYQTCSQCSESNKNPAYRFCASCYQERKNFFPAKPKPKNKRKHSSPSNSVKRARLEETSGETESVSLTQDSGFESGEWAMEPTNEKCLFCSLRKANSIFLHGLTCHRGFCYSCAKKSWDKSRRCPLCRRKISNVIRILNA